MIAKLSVWAPTRPQALARLRVALDELRIEAPVGPDGSRVGSLRTNVGFLRRLVRNGQVIEGETTTDLIERHPELKVPPQVQATPEAAVAASLARTLAQGRGQGAAANSTPSSRWGHEARREGMRS
jgi:acetyl/propionyl-CoA carboxylase alpha subunit